MAGAQLNDVKARIKSVSGTMQITKAMELVATSKLRMAKERAERTAAYSDVMSQAINKISSAADGEGSPFSKTNDNAKTLYIVIAGDRGLAGGFNSNIFKLVKGSESEESSIYLPIGKKAQEYYTRRQKEIYDESFPYSQNVGVGECIQAGRKIAKDFLDGKINQVFLVYTEFSSMMSQYAKIQRILPLESEGEATLKETGAASEYDPIFEGDPIEILETIVPDYFGGKLFYACCQSYASELAARRTAMNSANKNAEEMIDSLMLKFNRARQAVITQEITEIVSGAEAL